jgi:formamidopyrimidine-DNA glycosylase
MPELPEVETIATGLHQFLAGKLIKDIFFIRSDIVRGPFSQKCNQVIHETIEANAKVIAITRRAKRLIIHTSGPYHFIFGLGMTGNFSVNKPSDPLVKHTHFMMSMHGTKKKTKQLEMRYIDPRRFGKLWIILSPEPNETIDQAMLRGGMSKLGPEPFGLTGKSLLLILSKSSRAIKTLLLDQTKITGLGNIYADEALYLGKIHPTLSANLISNRQSTQLCRHIKAVLNKSINSGGTTFMNYKNAYGDPGSFQKMLHVYGKTGLPCRRCKTAIAQMTLAGRSTHFCPTCQHV